MKSEEDGEADEARLQRALQAAEGSWIWLHWKPLKIFKQKSDMIYMLKEITLGATGRIDYCRIRVKIETSSDTII